MTDKMSNELRDKEMLNLLKLLRKRSCSSVPYPFMRYLIFSHPRSCTEEKPIKFVHRAALCWEGSFSVDNRGVQVLNMWNRSCGIFLFALFQRQRVKAEIILAAFLIALPKTSQSTTHLLYVKGGP